MKVIRLIIIIYFFLIMIYNMPLNADTANYVKKQREEQSIIIEVSQNPYEIKKKLTKDFPSIEVVAVYDELLQGLALKAKPKQFEKLTNTDFIKGYYPVQTYMTTKKLSPIKTNYDMLKTSKTKNNWIQISRHSNFEPSMIHKNTQKRMARKTSIDELFSQKINREKIPLLKSEGRSLSEIDVESIVLPEMLNNTKYTGKGVKVAVIDTGIDMNHPDLKRNFQGGFDLVDLDDEPMETTKDEGMPTSHGTHVAGIIAANGQIKGVAPDAEIYAYRALGPGGVGSSVQVIAAMEQAIKDGVDVMNLSLGNTVNGPDYPTSKAVQEATKRGVAVIVANGNDGPNDWTIGAPATAPSAFSVGAYEPLRKETILYEPVSQKSIQIRTLLQLPTWNLERDYQITTLKKNESARDKIVLVSQKDSSIIEKIQLASEQGAIAILIQQLDEKIIELLTNLRAETLNIPIAIISKEDGDWLKSRSKSLYYKTIINKEHNFVASFSSRGPVTVNWDIKPNVIAPGVNILSTVPNGYDMYSGTSMAAPHVAGAFAILKEARPGWTNEQIFASLETTAYKLTTEKDELIQPHIQGNGLIDINRAINTQVIIENGMLSFGKINRHIEEESTEVTFYNVSNETQTITIERPQKHKGLHLVIPNTFTIPPGEKISVPFTLKINRLFLQEGLNDGWITIRANGEPIQIPYIFINETDSYKKVAGFSIQVNQFQQHMYTYELYVAERVKNIKVQLFDPETLLYEGTLIELKNISAGRHTGELKTTSLTKRGAFYGLIIVQLENGEIINEETHVYIP